MKFTFRTALLVHFILIFSVTSVLSSALNNEFTGQFEKTLVPNRENFERKVLKQVNPRAFSMLDGFEPGSHVTSSDLIHPQTGRSSVLTVLLEPEDEDPILFCDLNGDGKLSADERFVLKQEKEENPFLWNAVIPLASNKGFFETYPIFVRYFRSITYENMSANDRLVTQSTEVMARGIVDVNGSRVSVQYALAAGQSKVDPQKGWLGMDTNGDGEVDMDGLSPEAAQADSETVVFRVGSQYLSTKRADVSKNQIILRSHAAKDYKRAELEIGQVFPEFSFTDFDGKKRKFSEFRGKYVLLDIWGFWCPPCRKELPYIKESHRRFQDRNFEVVGLNTDTDFTLSSMKKALSENGMLWTNARVESVLDFIKINLRITAYPTTFLISPEGKILSMSRHERDEADLRGKDLLESLDEILPE